MKSRLAIHLFVLAFLVLACAEEKTSDPTPTDVSTTDTADVGEPDLYVPPPASDITASVEVDVTEGNAPLTVHLNCAVDGAERDELDFLWKIGQQPSSMPELDFTFYVEGDYDACCTAWRKDGQANVSESCRMIRVRGSAELSITNPKLTGPSEVAPGDCVTAEFDVRNNGAQIMSDFRLGCVLSANQDWETEPENHVSVYSETISGMDDGQYQTVTMEYTDLQLCIPEDIEDGPYFLLCKVDVEDVVNETNKGDNARFATTFITVDQLLNMHADLHIGSVGVIENQKFPKNHDDILTYNLTVTNEGLVESTQFVYEVYACPTTKDAEGNPVALDGVSGDCTVITDETGSKIYSLDPDVVIPIMRNWKVPAEYPVGTYCLAAKIDVHEQVVEENEDDNLTLSDSCFDVEAGEVLGTDLGISNMSCSPADAYWGGNVFVQFDVTNAGQIATPVWDYQVYMGSNPAPTPATSILLCGGNKCANQAAVEAGQTVTVTEVVTIPSDMPLSDYWCIVKLDVSGSIAELEESNNFAVNEEKVTVTSKAFTDIFVQNVSFTPSIQEAGEIVKVTYDVGNNDISTAAGIKICVAFSTDPSFSISGVNNGSDVLVHEVILAEVPGGSVAEYTDKVTVPVSLDHQDGALYYVAVISDCANTLSNDSPKGNNIGKASGQLEVLNPMGGCFEDDYDKNGSSNDDLTTAVTLEAGLTSDLALCNNDDWYKVSVPATYSMTVTMTVESPLWVDPSKEDSSDIDLEIRNANGEVIDVSNSAEPLEVADLFMAAETADFYIKVTPKLFSGQAHYSLDIGLTPPIPGIDLRPVDLVVTPAKTWAGGAMFLSWKTVNLGTVPAGVYATSVYLSTDSTIDQDDTHLTIFPKTGMPATSIVDNEETLLLPTNIATGSYYVGVVVDSAEAVTEVNEDNNWVSAEPVEIDGDNPCIDDTVFEPNNELSEATELDSVTGSYPDLVICPYLEDWYQIDLEVGQKLKADITYAYSSQKGFLYLQLIDPTGVAVLVEGKKANKSDVEIPYIWEAGTYYLRAYNPMKTTKSAPHSYTLNVSVLESAVTDVCVADLYENNNHHMFASMVGCGLREMTLCKKDVDWLQFDLPPSSTVQLTLNNVGQKMKMTIYTNPEGAAIPGGTKKGNGTLNVTNGAEEQSYYVKVEPRYTTSYPTSLDYTIFFDGIQGVDLEVKSVQVNTTEVVQGEDEFVSFKIMNQCLDGVESVPFALYLSLDGVLDESDVMIHEGVADEAVPGGGSLDIAEKFTVPFDTTPGTYTLLVVVDQNGAIEESNEENNISAGVVKVAKTCTDDALEPNDHPLWAPEVEIGTYESLQICPLNLDWYQVSLNAGETLTVTASFTNSEGDLDLRLYTYGEFNIPALKAFETGDGEVLTYTADQSDAYYIRVNGLSDASNSYDLSMSIAD